MELAELGVNRIKHITNSVGVHLDKIRIVLYSSAMKNKTMGAKADSHLLFINIGSINDQNSNINLTIRLYCLKIT